MKFKVGVKTIVTTVVFVTDAEDAADAEKKAMNTVFEESEYEKWNESEEAEDIVFVEEYHTEEEGV